MCVYGRIKGEREWGVKFEYFVGHIDQLSMKKQRKRGRAPDFFVVVVVVGWWGEGDGVGTKESC